jgi:hypothetical protein
VLAVNFHGGFGGQLGERRGVGDVEFRGRDGGDVGYADTFAIR